MRMHNKDSWIKVLNVIGLLLSILGVIGLYIYDDYKYSAIMIGIGSILMIPDMFVYSRKKAEQNPRTRLYWLVQLCGLVFACLLCNIYNLIMLIKFLF